MIFSVFPGRIRVIVTCETGSDSMQHFASNQAEIIKIITEPVLPNQLIDDVIARPSYVNLLNYYNELDSPSPLGKNCSNPQR